MAAMTAEQKTARLNQLSVWYQNIIGDKHKGPVPKALKEEFLADNGAWDFDRAKMWIRTNDKNWMATTEATDRVNMLRTLYRNTFGPLTTFTSKEFRDQAEAFARGNPRANTNETLIRIFRTRIMHSAAFAKVVPGGAETFKAWLATQSPDTDILTATGAFYDATQSYKDAWDLADTGKPLPKEILLEALKNNWKADGPQFTRLITSSSEFAGTRSYSDRMDDFNEKWTTMFDEGTPPPAGLAEKYARSNTTWDSFLRTEVSKTREFSASFPDYNEWKRGEVQQGTPEENIDVYTYFQDRQDFTEAWQKAYTNGTPVDAALLAQAMKENWSLTQWENKMKTLPSYMTTVEGQNKGERFDLYWKSMFGEVSPVNTELRGKYIASGLTDPSGMWDDIKQTQNFRDVYRDWDAFSAAQQKVGENVISDPALYNEYKAGFEKAFTDLGMAVPEDLRSAIFASGESINDLQQNASLIHQTNKAYELQSGQQIDVGTALGVKDKVAGGDLRIRLTKALEAQKALSQSKFKSFKTDQQDTGFITQKV